MIAVLLFSLFLFAAEPVHAPTESSSPEAAPTTEQSPAARSAKDRLVCRKETKVNSRFTIKTCKTVAEWEEQSEAAREAFAATQNRPMTQMCPPAGCT